MKQYLIAICSVIVILVGIYYFAGQRQSASSPLIGSTGATDVVTLASTATATTTYQYLKTNDAASTTLIATIGGADAAAIESCAMASTSASVLGYSLWFSMEAIGVAPTWFQESSPSVGGATATVLPITRSITLATTTTNYMCFDDLISPVGAKRMMVKYGVSGSNSGVYMKITSKFGY